MCESPELYDACFFTMLMFERSTVAKLKAFAGRREFKSQRPAKSYTALQTVHYRFNIYASCCVTKMPNGTCIAKIVSLV